MCELLVWTRPRARGEYIGRPDRGGVTFVAPDGWQWGREEIQSPLFRIVKLPGVPVATCAYLTERIRADDHALLERYKFITDLDKIESGKVLQPHDSVEYDPVKLLTEVARRIVPDPRMLG